MGLVIKPYVEEFHQRSSFREQIALLHPVDADETTITFLRSFVNVGQPGAASLDVHSPGDDTSYAWHALDNSIEDGVRGVFHTHPPGVLHFSGQDELAQVGLAKAHGKRMIWHGVQACDNKTARWVAYNMVEHQVFMYDLGVQFSDLNNPVVVVPCPLPVRRVNGFFYIVGGKALTFVEKSIG